MLNEPSDILTVQRAQYINWCNNRNFLSSPLIVPTNSKHMEKKATAMSKRSVSLPPELLMEIFSYLDGNQAALHSVSLVCKQWFYCAAPILYCHPQINDTYRWATFILTLTRERMSFFYGDLIKSIDLSSGKSIEAMKDQEFYRRLSDANDNEQLQQQQQQHTTPGSQVAGLTTNNRFFMSSRREYRSTEAERRRHEHEYVVKGLPFIIVSTSSLLQVSKTCKNLTSLNLSYTSLLHDSVIAETGEYLSTLQRYAVQPGLTHIQIPIEDAIEAIGKSCYQLEQVKIQRCEWVTAQVIWLFAYHCPNLKRLDARRSTKCTVKKLIANVLELPGYYSQHPYRSGDEDDVALPSYIMPDANGSITTASLALPRFSTQSRFRLEGDENHAVAGDDENQTIVIEPRAEDQVDEAEDQGEDAPMIHFRFNVETGLWEREVNGQLGHMTDNADAIRNGTFWFVPLSNGEDDVSAAGRRPPSPVQHTLSSQSMPSVGDESLKDIIRTVIMDCKDLGAIDLNWISDYN
ncbi:54S ribosomal protein L23, mitochondrial [Mucor velutinosus]|uniref:54S ribosomal protein L23, mitochondrial n=1 Tax=Mucor velutinosus TaxID=708070 RepID=A0AAN7DG33_9FUNG|nr:54S ribosomal protein L23, mitochondrial [Mucor velutinosus]